MKTKVIEQEPKMISITANVYLHLTTMLGFPGDSDSKESAYSAGDSSSILGSGRSPGEGNGNPLQYSCLENSRTRNPAGCPWSHKELDTTE